MDQVWQWIAHEKHHDDGYKLGEFQCKDSVTLFCVGVTQSLYKHKILWTYNKNFEP